MTRLCNCALCVNNLRSHSLNVALDRVMNYEEGDDVMRLAAAGFTLAQVILGCTEEKRVLLPEWGEPKEYQPELSRDATLQPAEECPHEWIYVDTSQGDGVWTQSSGYDECVWCDATREAEEWPDYA